jgi:hypothetical protein
MVLNFLKGHRTVKVEMEDGTQKTAKMVEGSGVFVCDIHKYITEDINEFRMHEKTELHIQDVNTTSACVICNANVDLTGKPTGLNAVCDQCEQRLLKSQETARARIQANNNKGVKSK